MIIVKNPKITPPELKADVNVGIMWVGSSTPTGWTAITDLDGYFIMAGASKDYTARGSETHTHTTNSASLLSNGAHTNHSVTVSASSNVSGYNSVYDNAYGKYYSSGHWHAANSTQGTPTSAGGHTHTLSSTNTGSGSNYPPYTRLRFIKVSSSKQYIPSGGIILWSGSSAPSGFSLYSSMSTYGFVLGSSSTGTGGTSTHSHTIPNANNCVSHTHDVTVWTSAQDGNENVNAGPSDSAGTKASRGYNHTHPGLVVTSTSGGIHLHTIGGSGTASSLPNYYTLYFIQASSNQQVPIGAIALWDSTLGIPDGWEAFSAANGYFIKYGAPGSKVTRGDHNHTFGTVSDYSGHGHPAKTFTYGAASTLYAYGGTGKSVAKGDHTHTATLTLGNGGPHSHTLSATTTGNATAANCNPPYKIVRLIKRVS